MQFSLTVVTAFAALCAALPHYDVPHVMHEKRHLATPASYVKRSELPRDALLPVRIGMTQSNLDHGHNLLMDISNPRSPNYAKHLTVEEVHDLFAPSQDAVDAVSAWLRSAGVKEFSPSANRQWMQLDMTAEELGSLLRTKYHEWEHVESGDMTVACDEYHVPKHVAAHIDYITPGIKLYAKRDNQKRSLKKRDIASTGYRLPPILQDAPADGTLSNLKVAPTSLAQCDRLISPQCIRALYNITYPSTAAAGNELGIFEDLGDIYDQPDLNLFFQTLTNITGSGRKPVDRPIDGAPKGTTQDNAGVESLLDLTLSMPLIYPQQVWLYQTDDLPTETNYTYDGFLNNFFDGIDGSYCSYSAFGAGPNDPLDPPYPDPAAGGYKGKLQCGKWKATNVISISYGGNELDLPASYQQRQCSEIMKLGLQGTTVVVSSGDSGVGYARGTNNPDCLGPTGQAFVPDFPATCPYITAAGSTYLPRGSSVYIDAERATDRFPSGGGFSNIYPTPEWQNAAVSEFIEFYQSYPTYNISGIAYPTNNQTGPGIFNRGGRGYPDIGALGDNVLLYADGSPLLVGGTSASSPIFASIITRINENRILAGKNPVGFINPTLYANPGAFHDITVGSNPNCGTPGFNASPGWDPVTGLGTPNYPALLKVFMALP